MLYATFNANVLHNVFRRKLLLLHVSASVLGHLRELPQDGQNNEAVEIYKPYLFNKDVAKQVGIKYYIRYTWYTQKNDEVPKVNKKFISHLTRSQRTPSAAATVQVSHALPTVRLSCLLRGRGASFQDGVASGKGFLCAPF